MELEAENLWVHSASHDFYDKTFSSKNYYFLVEKNVRRKVLNFSKIIFKMENCH